MNTMHSVTPNIPYSVAVTVLVIGMIFGIALKVLF